LNTGSCRQYGEFVTPQEVIERALFLESKIISFTYNEPTVWYEFVYETSVLAKENGLLVVWVTNGSITPEALENAAPYIDAYSVDIKSFSNGFYQKVASAELDPVLASVLAAKKLGIHVETVTLLIPNHNDSIDELEKLAKWIASNLGSETPVHLTAFKPHFKMKNEMETPVSSLERARAIFLTAGLEYVYIGNVMSDYQNTYCPNCHTLLASRRLLFGEAVHLKREGGTYACSYCGHKIPFICSEDEDFFLTDD
jgi:pyruvate formate lyase activating enzyme